MTGTGIEGQRHGQRQRQGKGQRGRFRDRYRYRGAKTEEPNLFSKFRLSSLYQV